MARAMLVTRTPTVGAGSASMALITLNTGLSMSDFLTGVGFASPFVPSTSVAFLNNVNFTSAQGRVYEDLVRATFGGTPGRGDGLGRVHLPGAGQHRQRASHRLDGDAQQRVVFLVGERGGFTRRTGHHHTLRAAIPLLFEQRAPSVQVEFARRQERRGQCGDAAGKVQSQALGGDPAHRKRP